MELTVLDYLESSESRFPDKLALKDNKAEFTYRELKQTAQVIGSYIAGRTEPNHSVVIYMGKTVLAISAFLGSVYAGCYYTPLDNQMPLDRVEMILDNLQPEVVIYDDTTRENLETLKLLDRSIHYTDVIKGEVDAEKLAAIRAQISQTDLMYILFTSGSTGVPKGVTITHLGVIDMIDWAFREFHLDDSLRVCNQAPFYFDLSMFDMYISLKAGGTLYVPPKTYYTFPVKILQYLNDNQINFINWAPSCFANAVNTGALDVCVPKYLKIVFFAGEVLSCRHYNAWKKLMPEAVFVNAYGPTEITYICLFYVCDRDFSDDDVIPLGHSLSNCRVVLLGDDLKEVPQGELGEICVMGRCVSPGYFNAPEKTREVFIQNPLNTKWDERMYKTGDLAYVNERGELVYTGRKDSQIKRLGYRIELGEIENAVMSMEGIANACCMYDSESQDIFVFYEGSLTEDEIIDKISEKVPAYMYPNRFVQLEEMPLNLNGKIDRPLLKKTYF